MTCLRRGKGSDFVGFNALRLEGRLLRFDGEYRWYLLRFCPLRDETGNIVNWYGTNTDIEDRKRADAALKRSEAFFAEGQHLHRQHLSADAGRRSAQRRRGARNRAAHDSRWPPCV